MRHHLGDRALAHARETSQGDHAVRRQQGRDAPVDVVRTRDQAAPGQGRRRRPPLRLAVEPDVAERGQVRDPERLGERLTALARERRQGGQRLDDEDAEPFCGPVLDDDADQRTASEDARA
jgi:hypothetical protein